MRTARLYLRLLGAHLRALLEYEADFWILVAATVLTQVVNVVFLSALFAKVPALNGWTFWPVLMMFGAVALAEGVAGLVIAALGAFYVFLKYAKLWEMGCGEWKDAGIPAGPAAAPAESAPGSE